MKCHWCPREDARPVVFELDDGSLGESPQGLCPACFKVAQDGFARVRAEYQALLAQGVHPKIADRILAVRYEREGSAVIPTD